MTDGAIGERIADIEDAEYVAIEVDGQRYVYEIIAGGSSKNLIRLNVDGVDLDDEDVDVAQVRDDAPTLAEVIREMVAF